jgi:hypothetical protein
MTCWTHVLYGVPGVEVVSVPPSHRSIVAGAIAATLGDAAAVDGELPPPVLAAGAEGALEAWEGLAVPPPQAVATTTRAVSSAAREALRRRRLGRATRGNVPSNSLLLSLMDRARGGPSLRPS